MPNAWDRPDVGLCFQILFSVHRRINLPPESVHIRLERLCEMIPFGTRAPNFPSWHPTVALHPLRIRFETHSTLLLFLTCLRRSLLSPSHEYNFEMPRNMDL